MLAIEFADPGPQLTPRPDLVKKVLAAALDRKLMLLSCGTYGQVVRVIPPLVTTDEEVDQAIEIIRESLATL
jgi:4-aminobutyrate aminotransferase-like enzyme